MGALPIFLIMWPQQARRMGWLLPPLFAKSWKRRVKPGAPEPLSVEALVAPRWLAVAVLFHFDNNGMGSLDKIVVLRSAGHGDLVIPLAQALEHP